MRPGEKGGWEGEHSRHKLSRSQTRLIIEWMEAMHCQSMHRCVCVRVAHLGHQAAVDHHRGAAIKVEAPAVAALLVGVQVNAARLGGGAEHEVQALRCRAVRPGGECEKHTSMQRTTENSGAGHGQRGSHPVPRTWFSLRSWWWLPLPLLMTSTPARPRPMCGASGVKSSSHVSAASTVSQKHRAAGGTWRYGVTVQAVQAGQGNVKWVWLRADVNSRPSWVLVELAGRLSVHVPASPKGHRACPDSCCTSAGSVCSSVQRRRFQVAKYRVSLQQEGRQAALMTYLSRIVWGIYLPACFPHSQGSGHHHHTQNSVISLPTDQPVVAVVGEVQLGADEQHAAVQQKQPAGQEGTRPC